MKPNRPERASPPEALLTSATLEFFNIGGIYDLTGTSRAQNLVRARWALAYILFHHVGWQQYRVARFLNMHRSSIVHALERAEQLRKTDELFYESLQYLERSIFE